MTTLVHTPRALSLRNRVAVNVRWLMADRRGKRALALVMFGINIMLGASVPLLLPLRWITWDDVVA